MGMMLMRFAEFVALRDGVLLPSRPPLKGVPRLNPFPVTQAKRKQMQPKPVRVVNTLKPTVRPVTEIVPPKFVAKLKPTLPHRA